MKYKTALWLTLFFVFATSVSSLVLECSVFFEKYTMTYYSIATSTETSDGVVVTVSDTGTTMNTEDIETLSIMKSVLIEEVDRITSILADWSRYNIMITIGTLAIVFLLSLFLGSVFEKSYAKLCLKVDEISLGNYSEIREKGIFSKLMGKFNILSKKMDKEQSENNKATIDERNRIMMLSDEVQAEIARAKGLMEVLIETRVIPDKTYEQELTSQIYRKICNAEKAANQIDNK